MIHVNDHPRGPLSINHSFKERLIRIRCGRILMRASKMQSMWFYNLNFFAGFLPKLSLFPIWECKGNRTMFALQYPVMFFLRYSLFLKGFKCKDSLSGEQKIC